MRVVIADDALLLREGLARILTEIGFEVAGLAADVAELERLVAEHTPDVAVVDIRMPPTFTDEGIRAARAIRSAHPRTGVLVLSQFARPAYALELLADGSDGMGYLLKDRVGDLERLGDAVRAVAAGESVLDPTIVSQLVGRRARPDPLEELTDRERDVLALMAEGRTNRAIGAELHISEHTVEKHSRSIFSKLDLGESPDDHRRVMAVLRYLDET